MKTFHSKIFFIAVPKSEEMGKEKTQIFYALRLLAFGAVICHLKIIFGRMKKRLYNTFRFGFYRRKLHLFQMRERAADSMTI